MPEKIILENDSTFVYYVDIEKGVIVAVMENPLKKANPLIQKTLEKMNKNDLYISMSDFILGSLKSPIRAKATCSEADEFNFEYGVNLAKQRCLAKYYKNITQMFVRLNNQVDPFLDFIEDEIIVQAKNYERLKEASEISKI